MPFIWSIKKKNVILQRKKREIDFKIPPFLLCFASFHITNALVYNNIRPCVRKKGFTRLVSYIDFKLIFYGKKY